MKFVILSMLITVLSMFPAGSGTAATTVRTADSLTAIHGRCWQYSTPGVNISAIASDSTRVYLAEEGARLEAISAATGERIWFTELGGEIISNIAVGSGFVFVSTSSTADADTSRTSLRSISSETGITNWTTQVSGAGSTRILLAGNAVLSTSADGSVLFSDGATGAQLWAAKLSGASSAVPVIGTHQAAVGISDTQIKVLSLADGKTIADINVPYRPITLALDGRELYWGDDRGNVFAYDVVEAKHRWKLKHGGRVTGMRIVGDGLATASADNFIYMHSRSSGNLRWKKRQSSRITSLGNWINGSLIILDAEGESASVLDSQSGRLLSSLTSTSGSFIHAPSISDSLAVLSSERSVTGFAADGCSAK